MHLKHFLAAGAVAAFMIAGTAAKADVVIGTEDSVSGFVGDLFQDAFTDRYTVASDGESPFDPFGVGYDTSDGIRLSGSADQSWIQASDSHWNDVGGLTWVLPADLTAFGCGVENGTTCEPVGHFLTGDGVGWNPGAIGTWLILEQSGALSDRIVTFNDHSGAANILFYSDPSLFVPEPATWAMMLIGFFGLGTMVRSRKTVTA
jgi:hypothetical protein